MTGYNFSNNDTDSISNLDMKYAVRVLLYFERFLKRPEVPFFPTTLSNDLLLVHEFLNAIWNFRFPIHFMKDNLQKFSDEKLCCLICEGRAASMISVSDIKKRSVAEKIPVQSKAPFTEWQNYEAHLVFD